MAEELLTYKFNLQNEADTARLARAFANVMTQSNLDFFKPGHVIRITIDSNHPNAGKSVFIKALIGSLGCDGYNDLHCAPYRAFYDTSAYGQIRHIDTFGLAFPFYHQEEQARIPQSIMDYEAYIQPRSHGGLNILEWGKLHAEPLHQSYMNYMEYMASKPEITPDHNMKSVYDYQIFIAMRDLDSATLERVVLDSHNNPEGCEIARVLFAPRHMTVSCEKTAQESAGFQTFLAEIVDLRIA